jgi:hypothetical protein
MYVYCFVISGFNDILATIERAYAYCQRHNRILLLDTVHSLYRINFSDYFSFKVPNIICDRNEIIKLCETETSTYPSFLSIQGMMNRKYFFTYSPKGLLYDGKLVNLPDGDVPEKIIIYASGDGGLGYPMFKELNILPILKQMVKERHMAIPAPYLSIQVRNTDLSCDYKSLYETNKEYIHSYNNIHIATDDKAVVQFFREKGLTIHNYTTFPSSSAPLHKSNIESHTKIIDLLSDIYIITQSDNLLSNSRGNFITLVRTCIEHKADVMKQFE